MPRINLLRQWLDTLFLSEHACHHYSLEQASEDASFRRYFRLIFADGHTQIVMDAPPSHEDCRPFLNVAELFSQSGVHVPKVYATNLANGFLLLSDLGKTTYLEALNETTAHALYDNANEALIHIQLASQEGRLPEYDRTLLLKELELFPKWYINHHLRLTLDAKQEFTLHQIFEKLLSNALSQPKVYVHRDYHSRNLMLSGQAYPKNPGILDFQDAVYGPITYDLVSLYRDAYINWEEEHELEFVIRYWQAARRAGLPVYDDFSSFYQDYEWMGVQRQIKVLGIFARLYHRDGKDAYLNDMPRVMAYLQRSCERYSELHPMARLLNQLQARQVQ